MDFRMALEPGTQLWFAGKNRMRFPCTITKELGRGGSCIVYEAFYLTGTGDKKRVRVKECYPYQLRLRRNAQGVLEAEPSDLEKFEACCKRMEKDFVYSHQLFYSEGLYDKLTNTIDVYRLNHTVYQVSAYSSDKTLAVCQPASLKSSNWQDYHSCRLEQKLREYEVIVHGSPGRRQHDRIYLRQTAWHSIPN